MHLLQNLLGRLKERLLLVHIRVLRRFAVCLLLYDFHFQQFSLLPIFVNLIYLLLRLVDGYSEYISVLLEREARNREDLGLKLDLALILSTFSRFLTD